MFEVMPKPFVFFSVFRSVPAPATNITLSVSGPGGRNIVPQRTYLLPAVSIGGRRRLTTQDFTNAQKDRNTNGRASKMYDDAAKNFVGGAWELGEYGPSGIAAPLGSISTISGGTVALVAQSALHSSASSTTAGWTAFGACGAECATLPFASCFGDGCATDASAAGGCVSASGVDDDRCDQREIQAATLSVGCSALATRVAIGAPTSATGVCTGFDAGALWRDDLVASSVYAPPHMLPWTVHAVASMASGVSGGGGSMYPELYVSLTASSFDHLSPPEESFPWVVAGFIVTTLAFVAACRWGSHEISIRKVLTKGGRRTRWVIQWNGAGGANTPQMPGADGARVRPTDASDTSGSIVTVSEALRGEPVDIVPVGANCKVFSLSQKKWCEGRVTKSDDTTGWVTVLYMPDGPRGRMREKEMSSSCEHFRLDVPLAEPLGEMPLIAMPNPLDPRFHVPIDTTSEGKASPDAL
jgi:hypothetical protein